MLTMLKLRFVYNYCNTATHADQRKEGNGEHFPLLTFDNSVFAFSYSEEGVFTIENPFLYTSWQRCI